MPEPAVTISFGDAARAHGIGSIEGWHEYQRTGERVHVDADGSWRAYVLCRATTSSGRPCAHCGRPIGAGDPIIRYGHAAWFTCCLACVDWHAATTCAGHATAALPARAGRH